MASDDVFIPTFINVHLFWIIRKKDLILRSAMSKVMHAKCRRAIHPSEEIFEEKMVAVNVDGSWARGIIENIIQTHDEINYVCWLPDYGVMRSVHSVFHLPKDLEKCPYLAKQASLNNVVNLTMDLIFGSSGYELQTKKTINDNPGIRQVALNCLEEADKTFFSVVKNDGDTLCGDIICVYKDNTRNSLTEILKLENLLSDDEEMFKTIKTKRLQFREIYFEQSQNWQQNLDTTEKVNISNQDIGMEYFTRTSNGNVFHNSRQ